MLSYLQKSPLELFFFSVPVHFLCPPYEDHIEKPTKWSAALALLFRRNQRNQRKRCSFGHNCVSVQLEEVQAY